MTDNGIRLRWRPIAPVTDVNAAFSEDHLVPERWHVQILGEETTSDPVNQTPAERLRLLAWSDVYVVQAVLRWLESRAWRAHEGSLCFIDLSERVLRGDELRERITDLLFEAEGLASRICLVLPEAGVADESLRTKLFANVLRETGCRLALSDFGSTGPSFRYVTSLPVKFIRLGELLRQAAVSDDEGAVIVNAVGEMCRRAGVRTIAPGVESEQALERIRGAGVDFVEGEHIGGPHPLPWRLAREA